MSKLFDTSEARMELEHPAGIMTEATTIARKIAYRALNELDLRDNCDVFVDAMERELRAEIERLRAELAQREPGSIRGMRPITDIHTYRREHEAEGDVT